MILKKQTIVYIFILLASFQSSFAQEERKTIWVTIFVHGAISIKPYLTLPNLVRLVRDKIDGTVYKESVNIIRDDPYIWQTQAMQGRGIQSVDMQDNRDSATTTLFSQVYDKINKKVYPQRENTLYYTYGWSGLFSHSVRSQEAEKFYEEIKELRKNLELEHPEADLKFSVVGYSHGGNIIQGAGAPYRRDHDKSFAFDEAVLIGTPIQPETKIFAHDPLFKKMFHFYSRSDKVVVLDFFSTHRFFSCRYFHMHNIHHPLPKNLRQIELRLSGIKNCFKRRRNKKLTPYQVTADFSPGHTELWSFAWVESEFRKDFPFYPLPIGVFTPYFKKAVEDYEGYEARHFVQHVHYDKGTMTMFPRFWWQYLELPFLPKDFVEELKAYTLENRPKKFHRYEYDAHINKAIDKVKAEKICDQPLNAKKSVCKIRGIREKHDRCLT